MPAFAMLLMITLNARRWRLSKTACTAQHVMVYHQPGRFGGWPANHGIWSWGNEILVGFSAGLFQGSRAGASRHRS